MYFDGGWSDLVGDCLEGVKVEAVALCGVQREHPADFGFGKRREVGPYGLAAVGGRPFVMGEIGAPHEAVDADLVSGSDIGLFPLETDLAWQREAACRGLGLSESQTMFFPARGESVENARAISSGLTGSAPSPIAKYGLRWRVMPSRCAVAATFAGPMPTARICPNRLAGLG